MKLADWSGSAAHRMALALHHVGLCVGLACAQPAGAEVFKCVRPSGEMVFSDLPCDQGDRFSKVRPSESVSDPEAAKAEVERQRAYAEKQATTSSPQPGAAALPDLNPPLISLPPTPLSPSSSQTR